MIIWDAGTEAHHTAASHLADCWEALDAEEMGEDEVQSPASAPFCGCNDCEIRETLHAAWPILRTVALLEASFDCE